MSGCIRNILRDLSRNEQQGAVLAWSKTRGEKVQVCHPNRFEIQRSSLGFAPVFLPAERRAKPRLHGFSAQGWHAYTRFDRCQQIGRSGGTAVEATIGERMPRTLLKRANEEKMGNRMNVS